MPRVRVTMPPIRPDVGVLLVTIPRWTRLNVIAIAPDSPAYDPIAAAVVVTGYIDRLQGRA